MGTSSVGKRTYFVVSISLNVTVFDVIVSLSTVIANGIPISSVLAYFFPNATPVLSVLQDNPSFFKEIAKS